VCVCVCVRERLFHFAFLTVVQISIFEDISSICQICLLVTPTSNVNTDYLSLSKYNMSKESIQCKYFPTVTSGACYLCTYERHTHMALTLALSPCAIVKGQFVSVHQQKADVNMRVWLKCSKRVSSACFRAPKSPIMATGHNLLQAIT